MIHCEYCDYYRDMVGNDFAETRTKAFCSFAGVMLDADAERPDREYPCKDMTYQECRNKERAPVSTWKLKAEHWKFAYRSRHPAAERSKSA